MHKAWVGGMEPVHIRTKEISGLFRRKRMRDKTGEVGEHLINSEGCNSC